MVKTSFFLVFKVNNRHEELTVIINIYCSIRASSKSSRSESAHPVSDTGAIKRQDTVDGSTTARKQSQFSNNSALGKLKFGFSERVTKCEKNLPRTFHKSVVFCARNSVIVKKSTKIFQNKCGQVVLYKL